MTFSIIARDKKSESLGIATATFNTEVEKYVPHIEKGMGVIATQGLRDVSLGPKALKLLRTECAPEKVLESLLDGDSLKEHRQIIIIDAKGRKAAFTGKETLDSKGHIIEGDYIIAGNFLANDSVIKEMEKAFKKEANFAEKLASALETGKKAGGDKRGERSAALIILSRTDKDLKLSVGDHPQPVEELKRLFKTLKK